MSCHDDAIATRPHEHQYCLLLNSSSSKRAGPSTWTRHPRSPSLSPYNYSLQTDLLDPLDEITLNNDLDQRSASSTTFLSHRVSPSQSTDWFSTDANRASSQSDFPARLSKSRQFLYPLHEPGEMAARRTQRLRARTAAIIASLPATSEELVDVNEHELPRAVEVPPATPTPKLRRVSGIRNLRRAFRDGNREPVHFSSISSLGISLASYELGILASPTPPLSHLSPRSSLRTLVSTARPQSSGDLKTLCGSTFSSVSIVSRIATKLHSTFPQPQPPHSCSSDRSPPKFPIKYLVNDPLTPRSRRHTSLQLDTPPSQFPGEVVWSCAKISQSASKRVARRGHPPRRIFSNPMAALSS